MPILRVLLCGAAVLLVFNLVDDRPRHFLAAAYPANPFKREALQKCLDADPTFVRFLPDQRSACYIRMGAL